VYVCLLQNVRNCTPRSSLNHSFTLTAQREREREREREEGIIHSLTHSSLSVVGPNPAPTLRPRTRIFKTPSLCLFNQTHGILAYCVLHTVQYKTYLCVCMSVKMSQLWQPDQIMLKKKKPIKDRRLSALHCGIKYSSPGQSAYSAYYKNKQSAYCACYKNSTHSRNIECYFKQTLFHIIVI